MKTQTMKSILTNIKKLENEKKSIEKKYSIAIRS